MIQIPRFLFLSLCFSLAGLVVVEGKNQSLLGSSRQSFPPAPSFQTDPLSEETLDLLETLTTSIREQDVSTHALALRELGDLKDPRIAWVFSDILRVTGDPRLRRAVVAAASSALSTEIRGRSEWVALTDILIAWDVPAFDEYLQVKRDIYTQIVPEWERLMSDQGEVDWRHVSWGGVGIDDRPYDETNRSVNSIPAVDNPTVTNAAGGSWLGDGAPVFGVVINGEARAYPRFIMEIREMVNDTLGGRDFAMPYCTLCGATHVWYTDRVPEDIDRPVLRTSGLLIRSNKLMYDVVSGSVFDTFLGHATNGPLYDRKIALPGHPVVSTTWGEWKAAHPATTILVEAESLGRRSDLRKTRDAKGPIFPVGDVDPRLSVHEEVLGVLAPTGEPVAFQVSKAKKYLRQGRDVSFSGVTIKESAGGLIALDQEGSPLVTHESFWFGWSQFRPDTSLWGEESM